MASQPTLPCWRDRPMRAGGLSHLVRPTIFCGLAADLLGEGPHCHPYSKTTSDYVFSWEGGLVSWKFKKQTILAQSIMKSEIVPLANCCGKVTWLKLVVRYSYLRRIDSNHMDPLL